MLCSSHRAGAACFASPPVPPPCIREAERDSCAQPPPLAAPQSHLPCAARRVSAAPGWRRSTRSPPALLHVSVGLSGRWPLSVPVRQRGTSAPRGALIPTQVFTTQRPALPAERDVAARCNSAAFSSGFLAEERPDSGFRKLQRGGAAPAPARGAWMHPVPAVGFGEQRSQADRTQRHRSPPRHSLASTDFLPKPEGRDFFIQRKPMRTAGDKQTGELPAVRTAPREEICLTLEEGPEGTGPAASFIALLSAGEAATSEQLR